MTDHASLRAALAGGAEFDDMTIITVRKGDLRALLADADRSAALEAERDRLREALDSIWRYGADTLSGRTDGPDDRAWQRAAVREMTRRARAALAQEQS